MNNNINSSIFREKSPERDDAYGCLINRHISEARNDLWKHFPQILVGADGGGMCGVARPDCCRGVVAMTTLAAPRSTVAPETRPADLARFLFSFPFTYPFIFSLSLFPFPVHLPLHLHLPLFSSLNFTWCQSCSALEVDVGRGAGRHLWGGGRRERGCGAGGLRQAAIEGVVVRSHTT